MSQQPEQSPGPEGGTTPPQRRTLRLRRWLVRLGIVLVALTVAGGAIVGVGEHYTAQPNFCASCHIMEPYYASWKEDVHGGKLGIACVDCHYAPGERTTINAKLRGLSQVASYFSGRYGKTRPRAHVAQESCLTSNCHGDGRFLDTPLMIGTVKFVHSNHLLRSARDEHPHQARLTELAARLEQQLGPERFAQLRDVVRRAEPARQHAEAIDRLYRQWDLEPDEKLLSEFSQLEHRGVRIAQLQSLQCVDCHSYSSEAAAANGPEAGQPHFRVQRSSCFTCHFNNQEFNVGTAECMLCHTPPQTAITVHEPVGEEVREKLGSPELGAEPIRMDHSDIVARKLDCRACHADVILGESLVTRRDCERCHDQPRYFEDWQAPIHTDQVARYHAAHVPQQRAKCLDCHSPIRHQLAPSQEELAEEGFLPTAMADCRHCHPTEHQDQLKLLLGRGGQGVAEGDPNMMFGARTNCYGCHTEHKTVNGKEVLAATKSACIACHGEEYAQTFEQWKEALDTSTRDAQEAVEKARAALEKASTGPAEARVKAEQLVNSAEADLQLVQRGHGVHNIMYALQLLDSVTARCGEAEEALAAESPPQPDPDPAAERPAGEETPP
jgi:predicted CXXCH cytochrome family protein